MILTEEAVVQIIIAGNFIVEKIQMHRLSLSKVNWRLAFV